MAEGMVTWFNPEQGYGFLVVLDHAVGESRVDDQVLVHRSDIQRNGDKTLEEGEHVSFDIERDATGKPVARFVTPLGGPPPQYLLDRYAVTRADQPTTSPADHAAPDTGRPEMTEHFIYKDNRMIVLERGLRWDAVPGTDPIELERMTAHCGVRALASLCEGLIRPMSFGVTRQWVDDEYGIPSGGPGLGGKPPRWNWFVKTPQSPPWVDSGYVDAQVMEPVALDELSMLTAVDRVLDDPCAAPDGDHLGWDELLVDHTWARLPEPDRHVEDDELRIDDYDGGPLRLLIPLERAHGHTWVTAPSIGVWQPFMLRVSKPFGARTYSDSEARQIDEFLAMDIHVDWSFWWEPGEGRAMLDHAVDRLLRQGWRQVPPRH